jgi:hypothetical protein
MKTNAGDTMTKKVSISRREILRSMAGAGAALPFVAAGHPFLAHLTNTRLDEAEVLLTATDWAPRFLSPTQNILLISLSEAIVPGSRDAEVNRFIDLLLSVDTKENQAAFVEALESVDSAATKQFGKPFLNLPAENRVSLLMTASEVKPVRSQDDGTSQPTPEEPAVRDLHGHFENLKGWISGAYYSSEAGMKELGWTPNRVFAHFPQCEHPDDHV